MLATPRIPSWVYPWDREFTEIPTMGTKIGSKYGKTPGKVKNYPPIMGAAEGRPHKGYVFLYFSWCFSIFGPYFGTHSVNSLSQGYTQEPVPEQPVYLHPVCRSLKEMPRRCRGSNISKKSQNSYTLYEPSPHFQIPMEFSNGGHGFGVPQPSHSFYIGERKICLHEIENSQGILNLAQGI